MNDDELSKLIGISQTDQNIATADSFGVMVATAVMRYYQQCIAHGATPEAALTLTSGFQTAYMTMLTSLTAINIQRKQAE